MGQEQAHQGQRPEGQSQNPEGLADPELGLLPAIYWSQHGGDESRSGSVGSVDNFRHGMAESISCARKRTGRIEIEAANLYPAKADCFSAAPFAAGCIPQATPPLLLNLCR